MTHLKRQRAPKRWPIPRKGTKYVVRPNFNPKRGLPILIVLRDLLGVCQNRREVKKAITGGKILVNMHYARDDKNSLLLFDVLTIVPSKQYYRLSLSEKGKFILEEIPEIEAGFKISKIINKKILKGKKTQINLLDGKNFLSNLKCSVGDSMLIDLKKKKIKKCFPLKQGVQIFVFAGKHAGKRGVIKKLNLERKMAEVNTEKEHINVLIKQLMVLEK